MTTTTTTMTEAQRTYQVGQLDAMPIGARVNHGRTMVWTKGQAGAWLSDHDGVSASADVVSASDGDLITYPEAWDVPRWPAPVAVDAPGWATMTDEWTYIGGDDNYWRRVVKCPFRSAEGYGLDVAMLQEVDIAGNVTVCPIEAVIDELDEMTDPADVLAFGQQIVSAGRMMAGLIPAQRTA